MISMIRKIDRALKDLYNIEFNYRAEDFLVDKPFPNSQSIYSHDMRGALFIKENPRDRAEITLGIYLSPAVCRTLSTFKVRRAQKWTHAQTSAFTVASEEISHFHYLLYHAILGRSVSQLELELQGEVDKFMLAYFANLREKKTAKHTFEKLFEQLFYQFSLFDHLTSEQRERYLSANSFAKKFILRCEKYLKDPSQYGKALRLLRKFYHLNSSEKISLSQSEVL